MGTAYIYRSNASEGLPSADYECMSTVDEDIAEIKAELLLVKENFTKVDVKMDEIDVEIVTNKMNSDEADQCLREDFEQNTVEMDKVIII